MLFHFTREIIDSPLGGDSAMTAYNRLNKILSDGHLKGATGYIKGGHQCVCFSEAPVGELAAFFSAVNSVSPEAVRYRPYGIAVRKDWLFSQGGRPVIYQPDNEYENLPATHNWRHAAYSPPNIDFSWEREWRVHTPQLAISPETCLAVVPTAREAHQINHGYSQLHIAPIQNTGQMGTYSNATWIAVSLDLYGLN